MYTKKESLFELEMQDAQSIVEQIEGRVLEPTIPEVHQAVEIIQRHLRKEAVNRQVAALEPEDLCPAQKRDMVRDLAKVFRG